MKLTRQQLHRLIRESCGDDVVLDAVETVTMAPEGLSESPTPVADMLIEMEVASRSLSTVVESVQNAAQMCHDCGEGVAEQAPLVEAMVAQAEALQEMLEAQGAVIQENAEAGVEDISIVSDVEELPMEELLDVVMERRLRRTL